MSAVIAKAGWLHRQSSVLKRWKRNWFVLYTDGCLKYFDNEQSSRAEEVYLLPGRCMQVYAGKEVVDASPPDYSSQSCLLKLIFHDDHLLLCAETPDDTSAWQMAINEARPLRPQTVPGSRANVVTVQGVPQAGTQVVTMQGQPMQNVQYYNTYPPGVVTASAPGQTTIICATEPYYTHRRYYRHRPLWWW